MDKHLWILDFGHGGINPSTGEYVTPGKRSPLYNNQQVFEGVVNREIGLLLSSWLETADIEHQIISPGWKDIPLSKRTDEANKIFSKNSNAVLISIHCNAGGGTGIEIYTSPGQTYSDDLASVAISEAKQVFPDVVFREDWSDGDSDKEAKFWMLTKTRCPAILTENLFMDNVKDFNILNSKEGVRKLALYHFNTILKIEEGYLL